MATSSTARTALPGPHWMLRYIGTDDKDALNDLVWSAGGAPPYSGISHNEASAVFDLIEDYMGAGQASAGRGNCGTILTVPLLSKSRITLQGERR